MDYQINPHFNRRPSTLMHIDLNSCFATIEQQANPLLRDKPIAVAAYDSPNGCILAPSVQSKTFGIKVGMRVKEAKTLCPHLIVLLTDPEKYRIIHQRIKNVLSIYTPKVVPKSIDEFVLDLSGTPSMQKGIIETAKEIKLRIIDEIGEYLTVSIGIGPNRFLAKTASNLHKPDGLDEINIDNYKKIYKKLSLTDLHGINTQNTLRLNKVGIYTVTDFSNAPLCLLRSAFKSILGYYWFLRLRGWEIDDIDWGKKSFGHSFSLPKQYDKLEDLAPILSKLVEKVGSRMRSQNYQAKGIHLAVLYKSHQYFHQGKILQEPIFSSQDIYSIAFKLLRRSPFILPVRNLAISCFHLSSKHNIQLNMFDDILRKDNLTQAIDDINERWGDYIITPAIMANTDNLMPDRIGFGRLS